MHSIVSLTRHQEQTLKQGQGDKLEATKGGVKFPLYLLARDTGIQNKNGC